ncbi:EPIDERMAL PATTERNING FACTOR-like protein 5 [Rutidosis leptorrhynchoides]|uniref:EPIDERMAL PATTERNING FACTOR-like protein 5 n=1 Tax=Rutidosis leptorrhynchoides TaxID=125765 RepID=UPI003A9A265B
MTVFESTKLKSNLQSDLMVLDNYLEQYLLLNHLQLQITGFFFTKCGIFIVEEFRRQLCQNLQSTQTAFVVQKGIGNRAKEQEMLSRLGSRPPICEHKCRGCAPCTPIQVPTTATPQYSNYEPEGWKCMCGSIYYNP